jgi:hypothetical protein
MRNLDVPLDEKTMARSNPPRAPQPPRARTARMADHAAELLIVLAMAGLAALWVTGAPVASLLPMHPPL